MTSKFVKYPAVAAPSKLVTGSMVDYDIADIGYVDLTRSYISVTADISTTEATGVSGVHAVNIHYQNSGTAPLQNPFNAPFTNSALISDFQLEAANLGVIESLQDANIVNQNMQSFQRDFENILSDNYKTIAQYNDPSACAGLVAYDSPFRRLLQNKSSMNVSHEMKIPLGDLSGFCNNAMVYDCAKMGKTRLHCRFDTTMISEYARERLGYATQTITLDDQAADSHDVTTPAGAATAIYTNPHDLGVIKGDTVVIEYTEAGPLVTAIKTKVTAVAVALGIITYTLEDEIPASTVLTMIRVNEAPEYAFACDDLVAAGSVLTVTAPLTTNMLYYANSLVGLNCFARYTDNVGIKRTAVVALQTVTNPAGHLVFTLTGANVVPVAAGNITLYVLDHPDPLALSNPVAGSVVTVPGTRLTALNLWVGQKVRVQYTDANPAVVNTQTTITGLSEVDNAGTIDVQVTLNNAVVVGTVATLHCIPANEPVVAFSKASLVLKTLLPQHSLVSRYLSQSSKQIAFNSFSVERANIPADSMTYQRIFNVENNCKNAFALLIQRPGGPLSLNYYVSSFRFRLNNIDVTNQAIAPFASLNTDMIMQCFGNSGQMKLKNISSYEIDKRVMLPCCVVNGSGLLQVEISFSQGSQKDLVLYLVKEVEHAVELSGRGASLM